MYELFIGNYERVIGQNVYILRGKEYYPCKVILYSFKTRKYNVRLENGKIMTTNRIYIKE